MSSNSMSLISEISFKFLFLSVQVWECPLHSDGLCERTTFGDTRWRSSSIWGWGYKEQYIAKYFLVQVGPLLTFVDENRVTVAVNNTLSRWFHAPVIVFNKYSSISKQIALNQPSLPTLSYLIPCCQVHGASGRGTMATRIPKVRLFAFNLLPPTISMVMMGRVKTDEEFSFSLCWWNII